MKTTVFALIAAGLLSGAAHSAPLNLLAFDDTSCAAWSRSNGDSDQRNAYIVWMRGFLTGHNYALPGQQVSSISSSTIESYVNRYCARTPTGSFSDAVMRLSDEFSGRNQAIRK